MEVGPGVSVVTKAEWSLRRERAQDGWGEGTRNVLYPQGRGGRPSRRAPCTSEVWKQPLGPARISGSIGYRELLSRAMMM